MIILKKNKIKKYNLNLPKFFFFFYVSSRANYKNFGLLVKAIKILKNNPKINVVCFGGGKFSKSEIDKYNLQDNFINIQEMMNYFRSYILKLLL